MSAFVGARPVREGGFDRLLDDSFTRIADIAPFRKPLPTHPEFLYR